jgi:hypothetical protein
MPAVFQPPGLGKDALDRHIIKVKVDGVTQEKPFVSAVAVAMSANGSRRVRWQKQR